MDEYAGIAVVVVALYLSECVVWARHGAFVLSAPFLVDARLRPLSRLLGTARGAFTLLNPLPPFGRVHIVEPWPFSVGAAGVVATRSFALAHEPRAQETARVLAWSDVRDVRVVDRDLHVGGAVFARCSTPRHARCAAAVLTSIASAPADDASRAQAIEGAVAAAVDVDDARARLARHAKWSAPLLFGATLTFFALFLFAPRIVYATGLAHWPTLLALIYAGVSVCAVSLFVAHRALQRDSLGERVMQSLLMLPAPTMAMRGNDKLGRALLAGLHPVAVALASLRGRVRDDVVGRALRDLAQPREPVLATDDAGALVIEREFRERVLAHGKRVAAAAGVDVEACFAAPALREGQVAWCPRCRAPFRQIGTCSDCRVPLVARS